MLFLLLSCVRFSAGELRCQTARAEEDKRRVPQETVQGRRLGEGGPARVSRGR